MSESTTRFRELLRAASNAFDNCEDPFCHSWLTEHEVTADECYSLSKAISAGIDLLLIPLERHRPQSPEGD